MCVLCFDICTVFEAKKKKVNACVGTSLKTAVWCALVLGGTFRTVEHSVGVSYDLHLKLSHSVTDQAEHHKASLLYTLCTD